jgi:hypothetical protein
MVPPAGALAGPGGGGTLPPMSRRAVRVPLLRNLTLKTKLLLMMLSLLVLSVSSLFLLHLYNERQLLSQLREYTEDLSTAIEVFQEQPAGEGDPRW